MIFAAGTSGDANTALIAILIFLVAAVVAVPLSSRLGFGSVLGYLLAGVLIAPLLGLVGVDTEQTELIGEYGVVFMLFLIGLELEPSRLWRLRAAILGTGGMQVLLTTLALTAIFMFLPLPWGAIGATLPWQTALFLGLALALSSTALVLQTIKERGQLTTPAGQSGFAVLLFQDIAVIPILAILPLLALPEYFSLQGASGTGVEASGVGLLPAWGQFLVVAAVIAAMVLAGRYGLRPIMRIVARTRMREIFVALSLLIVIGSAFLMQSLEISAALGTFIAGVVLADSDYVHALEADLDPFRGLLMAVFFISVGAEMNLWLFISQPLLIPLLVVGLLLVKLLILLVVGRIFGLSNPQNILFALLLSQGGEFAFVLLSTGLSTQVVDASISQPITVAVTLSMLITPLLLLLHDRLIAPRFQIGGKEEEAKVEDESADVIIIGFGRFGQVLGRLLIAQGVKVTVLDHDSDQIDFVRQFGFKVFYGDGSRMDLLEQAGAANAKLLVIAIDDPDKTVEIARAAQEDFPQLKIVARARNRNNAMDLIHEEVDHVEREVFESSLSSGRHALELLGYAPYHARALTLAFREHDLHYLERAAELRGDFDAIRNVVREGREELERVFADDRATRGDTGADWKPSRSRRSLRDAAAAPLAEDASANPSSTTETPSPKPDSREAPRA